MDPKRVVQGLLLQLTGFGLAAGALMIAPHRRFGRRCVEAACTAEHRALVIALALAWLASLMVYVGHRLDRRY